MITGITHERYWIKGKWLHWSVNAIFLSAAGHNGKTVVYCGREKPFPAGHSCGDGNLQKRWISEYVSFRTYVVDASVKCNIRRSRWFGDDENRQELQSNCLCLCACVHAAHMTVGTRRRVIEYVQMWFIHTSPKQYKFPTITLGWQGFSSLLCCSSRGCQCLSPVCQIQLRSSRSSLIMTWHAKRVGWWWRWGGEMEEGGILSPAGFILTSFPRAPHTSWNSLNYAHGMAQRSQRHSKKVLCDRLCTLEKLLHNIRQVIGEDRMCALNMHVIILCFAVITL